MIRRFGQNWVQLELIWGFNGKTLINRWIVETLDLDDHYVQQQRNSSSEGSVIGSGLLLRDYDGRWSKILEKANSTNATSLRVEKLQPYKNCSHVRPEREGKSGLGQATEIFQTSPDVP